MTVKWKIKNWRVYYVACVWGGIIYYVYLDNMTALSKITMTPYEAVKLCRKTRKQLSRCLMNRRISWHEGLYVHGIISKCIVYLDNMTALSKINMTRKWLFSCCYFVSLQKIEFLSFEIPHSFPIKRFIP